MSKYYKIFTDSKKIFISNDEALILEMKLNNSEYKNVWSVLGDILYKWRLDPTKYLVTCDIEYKVSDSQLIWILKNINQ